MKLEMFSVYDEKAVAFIRPFCMPNAQMAIRALRDSAQSAESAFSRNPGDYTLYGVGQFDEDTGEISTYGPPRVVATLLQLVEGPPIEEVIPVKQHA